MEVQLKHCKGKKNLINPIFSDGSVQEEGFSLELWEKTAECGWQRACDINLQT